MLSSKVTSQNELAQPLAQKTNCGSPSTMLQSMHMSDTQQQTIYLMDDVLSSQVAAGEVVERPASVIKELVENSIDAGAKSIRVEIERGGVGLIRVSDDGIGMSSQDVQMCLLRHATSKIRKSEDLFDIRQLGFRGEALPSIASVSQMRITTRRAQDIEGTLLVISGGLAEAPQQAGCAPGTIIEVRELFYNVPVRRKFLKKEQTEAAQVEHQLMLHALAFPELRFSLISNGRSVFDSSASKDLRQRIADFYGRDLARELIEIERSTAMGMDLYGYIQAPTAARRSKKIQNIFLNSRPIEDKILNRAIRDGFGGLPTGLHPALFLYLQVDPALVDVNVHPAKKEVRFRRINEVCYLIIEAMKRSLSRHARQQELEPEPEPASEAEKFPPAAAPSPLRPQLRPLLRPIVQARQQKLPLPPAAVPAPAQPSLTARPTIQPEPQPATLAPAPAPAPAQEEDLAPRSSYGAEPPPFRHIGSFGGQYALFEGREGLVMLSPRAARERLIFERLMESKQRPLRSQGMLLPLILEFDSRDMAQMSEVLPQLERAGFIVSQFGQRSLRFESLPSIFRLDEVEGFMTELLECFSTRGELRLRRAKNPYELFVSTLAHRYAQQENVEQFLLAPQQLLSELLSCEIPYCTPQGKPTMVPISLSEIQRKFQAR